MSAQSGGSGGASGTGLGAGTAAQISGTTPRGVTGPQDMRLSINLRGDQTFRLNIVSSVDDWATYEVVKQVASSVVNVDGGTTGYVNVAELKDYMCPTTWRAEVWAVGGTLAWKADYREVWGGR